MNEISTAAPAPRVVEMTRTFRAGEDRIAAPRGPRVASTRVLSGRVTAHEVTLRVSLEGTPRQIEETLEHWRKRSFTVTPVPFVDGPESA